jgi:hypothetical protein
MFLFFCPIPSLFLFLSLHQRRRWVEVGRREVPSTVICNQGNGQSLSVCETVATTREALHEHFSGSSLWFKRGCDMDSHREGTVSIPGKPMHNTRPTKSHYAVLVSPVLPFPPSLQISFHRYSLLVFNSSSWGRTKVTSEATDPETYPHLMTTMISVIECPLCD